MSGFARAFGHLKAIGHTAEARALFDAAGLPGKSDDAVVALDTASGVADFVAKAATRKWIASRRCATFPEAGAAT